MILLSVDPGLRACGCALFRNGLLVRAALAQSTSVEPAGPAAARAMAEAVWKWVLSLVVCGKEDPSIGLVRHLVLEWPQSYGGRAARGDPNSNLIPLAAVDGAIAMLFRDVEVVHVVPAGWKGQIPKPKGSEPYIIEGRVVARLSEAERAAVEWPRAKKQRTDVVDGIAIGLWALGRFERKRGGVG